MTKQATKYYRGLTKRQFDLLSRIACNDDTSVNPRSVQPLLDKGLVVSYNERHNVPEGILDLVRYDVPIAVHVEWAQWCAKHVVDDQGTIK